MTAVMDAPTHSRKQTREIHVNRLVVPDDYQREYRPDRARKIAANYDPDLDQPITVMQTDDSKYRVIDGQHRVGAKKILGHNYVSAIVVTKRPDEALLFADLNQSRRALRPLELFRAEAAGGRVEATEISDAVESHGLRIGNPSNRTISAIGALRQLYKRGGSQLVDATLDVIQRSWPDEREALQNYYLKGVGLLLSRYDGRFREELVDGEVDLDLLVRKLARVGVFGVRSKAEAQKFAAFGGGHTEVAFMNAIVVIYNNGLRSTSKLTLRA